MVRFLALALACTCPVLTAACSSSTQGCSARAWPAVLATVQDATSGGAICNATVHVVAPAPEHDAVGACPHSVFGPSPATYTLQISAPGYVTPPPVKIDVRSTGGTCAHAVTQTYTAKLQPEPGSGAGDAGKDGG